MDERKSVAEMFGEFCREAAVLAIVFYPLDEFLSSRTLGAWYLVKVFAVSFVVWTLGAWIEVRRKSAWN